MKAPASIETARLLLRRPLHSDAQAIFRSFAGDPAVTRYLSWPTHRSVADSYSFIEWSDAEWERWPAGPYLVFKRGGNEKKVLGSTGLAFTAAGVATTGYAFARDAWGRGFATEALGAVVEVARGLHLERLGAICHADHAASARVLEKCGFQRQGLLEKHTLFPNLMQGARADVLSFNLLLRD
jgi:RimJ/RimL family protein N-acetyltransferase